MKDLQVAERLHVRPTLAESVISGPNDACGGVIAPAVHPDGAGS